MVAVYDLARPFGSLSGRQGSEGSWARPSPWPSPGGRGDAIMLAKLKTFALVGIDALPVEVEVDVSPAGLPKTVLVGLPEAAVKESTHRVERAIVNSGFQRPQNRVIINLAPADMPKDAASFDLPIALGVLVGSGQVASELLEQYRRRRRTGPRRRHAADQGRLVDGHGRRRAPRACADCWCPAESAAEAAVVEGIDVIAVTSLAQAVGFLTGEISIEPTPSRLDDLFRELAAMKSISPTCGARRWPSGR